MGKENILDEQQNYYMWNPWHGCHKCSEGCLRCYMFERDRAIGVNSDIIKANKVNFRLPVQRKRVKSGKHGLEYKVPSGSVIMTSLTSDFFIEEADVLREDAWQYIHERYDCLFEIITKRPERIRQCLPENWLSGWYNVMISVTAENENRAWERIPLLLDAPIRHKGIVIEPMLEEMDIRPFLSSGEIETVVVGGESYQGLKGNARELKLTWVKDIAEQCKEYNVNFHFHQTGSRLRLENNQLININKRDEVGLAEFYKLDYIDKTVGSWQATAKQLELQFVEQKAAEIYKRLKLEGLL